MVARKQTPEGKRVTMGVKFSESEAAEINAARGNTSASEWLRRAALTAARASGRKPLPTDAITIIPDDRIPPGIVAMAARGPDGKPSVAALRIGPQPAPVIAAGCPHRLPRGAWCKTCGRTKG
jgi:hypothetical protein